MLPLKKETCIFLVALRAVVVVFKQEVLRTNEKM